jgi:hypothetical protein
MCVLFLVLCIKVVGKSTLRISARTLRTGQSAARF